MAEGFYNIVLVPDDKTAKIAVDLAHRTYSKIADGYCLEEDKVFTHITLTQFHTMDLSVVQNIATDVEELKSYKIPQIYFTNFYARFAEIEGNKCHWVGLSNKNTPDLANFQAKFHACLEKHGLKPLSQTLENYVPHVTFARVLASKQLPEILVPDYFMTGQPVGKWFLAIGHSDKNGQFLGKL